MVSLREEKGGGGSEKAYNDDMPPSLHLLRHNPRQFPSLSSSMRSIWSFSLSPRRIHVRIQDVDFPNSFHLDTNPTHSLCSKEVSLYEMEWVSAQRVRKDEGR